MAGMKERIISFLKEGLTLTKEQRTAVLMNPGGVGGHGAALPAAAKTEQDKIVGFTKPGECSCGRVHPIKEDTKGKRRIETGWF